jgi:hypothetical protein
MGVPIFHEVKERTLIATAQGEPPRGRARWTLHLLAAFGAFESWRGRKHGQETKRVRFMGISGLTLNAMFAMSIIAMAIPHLFLGACG